MQIDFLGEKISVLHGDVTRLEEFRNYLDALTNDAAFSLYVYDHKKDKYIVKTFERNKVKSKRIVSGVSKEEIFIRNYVKKAQDKYAASKINVINHNRKVLESIEKKTKMNIHELSESCGFHSYRLYRFKNVFFPLEHEIKILKEKYGKTLMPKPEKILTTTLETRAKREWEKRNGQRTKT